MMVILLRMQSHLDGDSVKRFYLRENYVFEGVYFSAPRIFVLRKFSFVLRNRVRCQANILV